MISSEDINGRHGLKDDDRNYLVIISEIDPIGSIMLKNFTLMDYLDQEKN
jgi:hypothetical protein